MLERMARGVIYVVGGGRTKEGGTRGSLTSDNRPVVNGSLGYGQVGGVLGILRREERRLAPDLRCNVAANEDTFLKVKSAEY